LSPQLSFVPLFTCFAPGPAQESIACTHMESCPNVAWLWHGMPKCSHPGKDAVKPQKMKHFLDKRQIWHAGRHRVLHP
jgi:hypothetical protein